LPNLIQAADAIPRMCWDMLMKATERLKAYSGLSARDSNPGRPEWEGEVLVRRLFRVAK